MVHKCIYLVSIAVTKRPQREKSAAGRGFLLVRRSAELYRSVFIPLLRYLWRKRRTKKEEKNEEEYMYNYVYTL